MQSRQVQWRGRVPLPLFVVQQSGRSQTLQEPKATDVEEDARIVATRTPVVVAVQPQAVGIARVQWTTSSGHSRSLSSAAAKDTPQQWKFLNIPEHDDTAIESAAEQAWSTVNRATTSVLKSPNTSALRTCVAVVQATLPSVLPASASRLAAILASVHVLASYGVWMPYLKPLVHEECPQHVQTAIKLHGRWASLAWSMLTQVAAVLRDAPTAPLTDAEAVLFACAWSTERGRMLWQPRLHGYLSQAELAERQRLAELPPHEAAAAAAGSRSHSSGTQERA